MKTLKFTPDMYELVVSGKKTQTRRINDKGFVVGDVVMAITNKGQYEEGITVKITHSKKERLHDIGIRDVYAELGVQFPDYIPDAILEFLELWDSIYPDHAWNTNPTVYVYEFEVCL